MKKFEKKTPETYMILCTNTVRKKLDTFCVACLCIHHTLLALSAFIEKLTHTRLRDVNCKYH